MKRNLRLDLWTAAFLASLGLPLVAAGCSEETEYVEDAPAENNTPNPHDCDGAQAIIVDGQDTGFDQCASGAIRRRAIAACPVLIPRETSCVQSEGDSCTLDSECGERAYGACALSPFEGICSCQYGCATDADCGDGFVCQCGDPVGRCVPATCTSDADCAPGLLCTTHEVEPSCGGSAFACQLPSDTCEGNGDCTEPGMPFCVVQPDGHRACQGGVCDVGRPFLVHGAQRLALACERDDWGAPGLQPGMLTLSASARTRLVERWTQIGLMEHASVAAFARFALQLMALGAPPELLVATQAAMSDETEHARLAFGLASIFGGRPVGPGLLSIEGALDTPTALEIAATTFREGCIGETVAALEAAELAALAVDPTVRAALERIARDEREHARLAWSTVRWILGEHPELREAIFADFEAALEERVEVGGDEEGELVGWGVPSGLLEAALRRDALEKVVRPALGALRVGMPPAAGGKLPPDPRFTRSSAPLPHPGCA